MDDFVLDIKFSKVSTKYECNFKLFDEMSLKSEGYNIKVHFTFTVGVGETIYISINHKT